MKKNVRELEQKKTTSVNETEEKDLRLFVNNVNVPELNILKRFYHRITVLKFCEIVNLQIPRFCYHDALSIAGNCRMCMVEPRGVSKPVVSCATTLVPGMKIYTNSSLIKQARENVLEFLLINHPLDCPICDQGGECDLQDISFVYGSDRGRFREMKRAVEDIMVSPFIKAIMTRCIHCTRCIRHPDEVAGLPALGTMGRGRDTEVGTYVQMLLNTEIVGNVIDLCPVGALTSQPYAFQARPWELDFEESIDVLDSYCSSIRIDIRGNTILRILPKQNKYTNKYWITDRARFFYDALVRQRVFNPLVNGRFVQYKHKHRPAKEVEFYHSSWENAFAMISDEIFACLTQKKRVLFFSGMYEDMCTIEALKKLVSVVGPFDVNNNFVNDVDVRNEYLISIDEYIDTTYVDLDTYLSVLFYIGFNPRHESPILNIKSRRKRTSDVYAGKRKTYLVGTPILLNYKLMHVGLTTSYAHKLSMSKEFYCRYVKADELSDYLLGPSVAYFSDTMNAHMYYVQQTLRKKGMKYQIVAANTGDISSYEYALCADARGRNQFLSSTDNNAEDTRPVGLIYALNSDIFSIYDRYCKKGETPTIIYHGPIASIGAHSAKIVLPSVTSVDKATLFLNSHGYIQRSAKTLSLPLAVWRDNTVFIALAFYMAELDDRINQRVARCAYNLMAMYDEQNVRFMKQYRRIKRLRREPEGDFILSIIFMNADQLKEYKALRSRFGLERPADEIMRMDYLKLYDPNCPAVFKHAHDLRLLSAYGGLLGWSINLGAAEAYDRGYKELYRKWSEEKECDTIGLQE